MYKMKILITLFVLRRILHMAYILSIGDTVRSDVEIASWVVVGNIERYAEEKITRVK